MGNTMYKKATELCIRLKKLYGKEMRFDDFISEFVKSIGGDKRLTIRPYLDLMQDFKMIEITEDGQNVQLL